MTNTRKHKDAIKNNLTETNKFKKPIIILVLATFCCILWGSAIPSLKISYNILNIQSTEFLIKVQFAGYRFLLAGIFLFIVLLIRKTNLKVKKEDIKYLFILGLFQTALMYTFLYNGVANVTGVKASIMTSLNTFFAIILPHFVFSNDRLNTKKIAGIIFGFTGVIYANIAKGPVTGGFSFEGEGFMILYALIGAIATILVKKYSNKFDNILMASYQMIIGSLMMIIFSSIILGGNKVDMTISFIPMLTYLAFISSAAFGIWFVLLSNNPISKITIYKFQVPIWGTLLSVLLIPDEFFNITIIVSLFLVSVGIYLVNAPDRFLRDKLDKINNLKSS